MLLNSLSITWHKIWGTLGSVVSLALTHYTGLGSGEGLTSMRLDCESTQLPRVAPTLPSRKGRHIDTSPLDSEPAGVTSSELSQEMVSFS